jgi:uncharacterized cofD-like protein
MKNIVVIGGGTGTFSVLSGLREYPFGLSAIVSTADDGGSTGVLRDELGVLPPGDIRQALVALSHESGILRDLFSYRFTEGSLKGHSFGNLFLSALEKVTGSFDRAVLEAGRILAITGNVIPATTDPVRLCAETVDGSQVLGEHMIEQHIWADKSHLKKLWLSPECTVHPLALQAIKAADLIVIAPGSIFTSLIPNLLVPGLPEAIAKAKAPVAYVVNLMTERGQTGTYFVQDFVDVIEQYLGRGQIDYVLYNTRLPNKELLERYKQEMERSAVRLDRKRTDVPYTLVGTDLLERSAQVKQQDGDAIQRTLIRHSHSKLAEALYAIMVHKLTKKYVNL